MLRRFSTNFALLSMLIDMLTVYAVVANITFSLFLELETFVWILMVASLFLATRPDSERRSPMP